MCNPLLFIYALFFSTLLKKYCKNSIALWNFQLEQCYLSIFLDFRETETDLIWPSILRHLVMTYFYLKWFISLFHFLDFVITLPVSIRYQQHRSMAKKILTWRKEYTTLTVFEENILRISLVLLLNICGMTKFKRDINSNKLFWTGVPVSSKRFFAYSSKVKNSNKKH